MAGLKYISANGVATNAGRNHSGEKHVTNVVIIANKPEANRTKREPSKTEHVGVTSAGDHSSEKTLASSCEPTATSAKDPIQSFGECVTPATSELSSIVTRILCPIDICKFRAPFANVSVLRMHLKLFHRMNISLNTTDGPCHYHCPESSCNYNARFCGRTISENEMNNGAKKHSEKKKKPVSSRSGKSFSSMKSIKQHYLKVHAVANFACANCAKKFATEAYMRAHSRRCSHMYECQRCASVLESRESMQTHARRIHNIAVTSANMRVVKSNAAAPTPARSHGASSKRRDSSEPLFIVRDMNGNSSQLFVDYSADNTPHPNHSDAKNSSLPNVVKSLPNSNQTAPPAEYSSESRVTKNDSHPTDATPPPSGETVKINISSSECRTKSDGDPRVMKATGECGIDTKWKITFRKPCLFLAPGFSGMSKQKLEQSVENVESHESVNDIQTNGNMSRPITDAESPSQLSSKNNSDDSPQIVPCETDATIIPSVTSEWEKYVLGTLETSSNAANEVSCTDNADVGAFNSNLAQITLLEHGSESKKPPVKSVVSSATSPIILSPKLAPILPALNRSHSSSCQTTSFTNELSIAVNTDHSQQPLTTCGLLVPIHFLAAQALAELSVQQPKKHLVDLGTQTEDSELLLQSKRLLAASRKLSFPLISPGKKAKRTTETQTAGYLRVRKSRTCVETQTTTTQQQHHHRLQPFTRSSKKSGGTSPIRVAAATAGVKRRSSAETQTCASVKVKSKRSKHCIHTQTVPSATSTTAVGHLSPPAYVMRRRKSMQTQTLQNVCVAAADGGGNRRRNRSGPSAEKRSPGHSGFAHGVEQSAGSEVKIATPLFMRQIGLFPVCSAANERLASKVSATNAHHVTNEVTQHNVSCSTVDFDQVLEAGGTWRPLTVTDEASGDDEQRNFTSVGLTADRELILDSAEEALASLLEQDSSNCFDLVSVVNSDIEKPTTSTAAVPLDLTTHGRRSAASHLENNSLHSTTAVNAADAFATLSSAETQTDIGFSDVFMEGFSLDCDDYGGIDVDLLYSSIETQTANSSGDDSGLLSSAGVLSPTADTAAESLVDFLYSHTCTQTSDEALFADLEFLETNCAETQTPFEPVVSPPLPSRTHTGDGRPPLFTSTGETVGTWVDGYTQT